MMAATTSSGRLNDLWSNSAHYRAECQTADDIETVVRLLDLAGAAALVDVGCGNGAFSVTAARAHPHVKVFAYDVLETAMDEYRAAAAGLPAGQVTCGVAPAERLPI